MTTSKTLSPPASQTLPTPASQAPLSPPAPPAPHHRTSAPEHRHDIDLLRLLCIGAVVLEHVGGALLDAVGQSAARGPAVYWTGLVADSFGRFAVPAFFAMAGWAVLVAAPPRGGRHLARRLVRIVVPMFVWTGVYVVWAALREDGDLLGPAARSLTGSIEPAYHLWYLYAYVPVLVVLTGIALVRSGRHPRLLIGALLACAAAPTLLGDLGRALGVEAPAVGWSVALYQLGYALAGAVLLSRPAARRRRLWTAAALAAGAAVLWYQAAVTYVIPYAHVLVGVFTVAVLLALSRVRVPRRLRPHVRQLAGASFGVYLVHVLVVQTLAGWWVTAGLGPVAAVLATVGLTVLSTALSFGACLLWQRAGLRRVLG